MKLSRLQMLRVLWRCSMVKRGWNLKLKSRRVAASRIELYFQQASKLFQTHQLVTCDNNMIFLGDNSFETSLAFTASIG